MNNQEQLEMKRFRKAVANVEAMAKKFERDADDPNVNSGAQGVARALAQTLREALAPLTAEPDYLDPLQLEVLPDGARALVTNSAGACCR